MKKIKLEFDNAAGETLAGLLEMPARIDEVTAFALFAHCDVVKLFDTPQLSGILHFQTLFFIIVRADITQRRM